GIEIKQLPGLPIPAVRPKLVADTKPNIDAPPPRPRLLSKRGADVLVRIERMLDEAAKALGPLPTAAEDGKRQASKPGEDALTAALQGRRLVAHLCLALA